MRERLVGLAWGVNLLTATLYLAGAEKKICSSVVGGPDTFEATMGWAEKPCRSMTCADGCAGLLAYRKRVKGGMFLVCSHV